MYSVRLGVTNELHKSVLLPVSLKITLGSNLKFILAFVFNSFFNVSYMCTITSYRTNSLESENTVGKLKLSLFSFVFAVREHRKPLQ